MFRGFKSSGFDSETTHITDDDRINTLMQVMGIAFCLAYKMGQIIENKKTSSNKKTWEKTQKYTQNRNRSDLIHHHKY